MISAPVSALTSALRSMVSLVPVPPLASVIPVAVNVPLASSVLVPLSSLSAVTLSAPPPIMTTPANVTSVVAEIVSARSLANVSLITSKITEPPNAVKVVVPPTPLRSIPPVVASTVRSVAATRSTPVANMTLSLASAAPSASPFMAIAPVSAVTSTSTTMPSSALTVNALKVEAAVANVTDALSAVAFNVTVPILLLFAAVMPLTVMLPLVPLPRFKAAAVISCISAPSRVKSPAVAPKPIVCPAMELLIATVPAPALILPVTVTSDAVTVRPVLVVLSVAPAPTTKRPPLPSESATTVTAAPVVVSTLILTSSWLCKYNPPVKVDALPEKIMSLSPAFTSFNVPAKVALT